MKAELQLPFIHRIGVLLHVAHLDLPHVAEFVAQRSIEPVTIIEIHLRTTTDVALTIDKNLVVQREVKSAGSEIRAIQRNVRK